LANQSSDLKLGYTCLPRQKFVTSAKADDRHFAVDLLLIFGVPLCSAGDVVPRLLAVASVQLVSADFYSTAGDLDLKAVGMGGEVVIPGRVFCCPIRGRDDQSAVGAFIDRAKYSFSTTRPTGRGEGQP
jgi:hypothetical protein